MVYRTGFPRPRPARVVTLLALAALFALSLGAADASAAKRPYVYIFSLDGLDRDAVLSEGDAPFLSELIADENGARSTFFPRSRSVMVAETNPNHTSMITGAYPKRHGIVGNEFATYGATGDEATCPAKPTPGATPAVTTGQSPSCIETETAFAAIERQRRDPRLTTALIMGKPKLARLFATQEVNPGSYDADYIWAPCDDDEPYCKDVPTNPVTGYALDDSEVMDEVIRTTRDGVADAGADRRPDLTFVNFPQIDSAGHATGRTSPAYAAAVTLADAEISRFVANQKELGIWKRTVMMVVSDHSMDDTPQFMKVSVDDTFAAAGIPSGAYEVVGNGSAAHIYLTDRTSPGRFDLLRRMRAALNAVPAITDALYRVPNPSDGGRAHTIEQTHRGWEVGGERSGDIVISTRPGTAVLETSEISSLPFNPLPGNHGSKLTRDNFWLIAGGGPTIKLGTPLRRVTNANAAPTATHLLGVKRPEGAQTGWARQAFKSKLLPGSRR